MSRGVDTAIVVLLFALAASLAAGGATKVVSTVAGRTGVWSMIDGTLAEAAFAREYTPTVELDRFGNLYYNEQTAIRMVTSTRVTTIAGGTSSGTADGIGTAAQFTDLFAMQFDATGEIMYMCDNHAIRQMVVSNRSVTTIAGAAGSAGTEDGPASSARFYVPYTPTVLGNGSIAITDNHNHAIRIVVGSEVWTIAGQKQVTRARRRRVHRRTASTSLKASSLLQMERLYLSQTRGDAPFVASLDALSRPSPVSLGQAGYADGVGSQARFSGPSSIKRLGSVLYLTEYGNGLLRRVDISDMSNVVVTTIAGIAGAQSSLDGPVSTATFANPMGLAVAPNFTIYFAQHFTRTLRQVACPAGFVGEDCDSCAPGYTGYPTCVSNPCDNSNCNGHATSVSGDILSGCVCTCATGYTGLTCDSCATHYTGYPTCEPILCDNSNCNNHASSVSGNIVSWLHMHVHDWIRRPHLRQLCDTLHRIPNVRADPVRQFELQQPRIELQRQSRERLHMHLRDWIRWSNLQSVRDELRGLPNMPARAMLHALRLQRPRDLGERQRRDRLHMCMRCRLRWSNVQRVCTQL